MTTIQLPHVIADYLEARDARETDRALALFDPDATVIDEGSTFAGAERIRWWLDNAASEFTFTRVLTGVEQPEADAFIVSNHLAGDFPGGEADLRYRFDLAAGLIARLEIAP